MAADAKDAGMEHLSLSDLIGAFSRAGVTKLYAKRLSENDNSKNQVYLGGSLALLNQLPISQSVAVPSAKGNAVIYAPLALQWMRDDGVLVPAPHSKLILYPQYPEVRLSGFLRGAKWAPAHLMGVNSRIQGRVLLLGVRADRAVIARVLSPRAVAAQELSRAELFGTGKLLVEVQLAPENPKVLLLARLEAIAKEGWVNSCRLDAVGNVLQCKARNCGGLTLEARLGIRPNAIAGPDLFGWEIKQFAVRDFETYVARSPITLFTPEPTGGFYASQGAEAFVRKYGYPDKNNQPDRLNFGGRFVVDRFHKLTGLTLRLSGFDADEKVITDPLGGLMLVDQKEQVAALWPFTSLIDHWNRKHDQACYVPSQMRKEPREYRFAKRTFLGTGTDFGRFLAAVGDKRVFYDPGIKVEGAASAAPHTHRRSQFRISFADLGLLYENFSPSDAATPT